MTGYELLTPDCAPAKDCPKVVRIALGELVVVGEAIATTAPTATVAITIDLYRAAVARLTGGRPGILRETDMVQVSGDPVTDQRQLVEFGVGPGEGAVRINESAFLALATGAEV